MDGENTFRADMYDRSFFEKWGAGNEEYIRSARQVARIIYEQYRPKTVLDLGCGAAFHSVELSRLGAKVVSADFSICPVELRAEGIESIEKVDLMQLLASDRFDRVDLTICLDVAEHLPHESSETLIANCTSFSDLVLFSAAPPGQGGIGHINEQPRHYWFERFAGCGFRHCRREGGWLDGRGLACREILTLRWMITQVAVFRKGLHFPYPEMKIRPYPP